MVILTDDEDIFLMLVFHKTKTLFLFKKEA